MMTMTAITFPWQLNAEVNNESLLAVLSISMPLIISDKDIYWNETSYKIKIIIPLQSRVDVKTSVLLTSLYLKISSSPWLWECFLAAAVDVPQCYVTIEDNRVCFELKKKVMGIWNSLEDENKSTKTFCNERRLQAYEENKKRLEDMREESASKKNEIHQASVRKQMQLDDHEREMIEKAKKTENERVAAEIERMRKEQRKADEIALKRKQIEEKIRELPPTRKNGHITVKFTPRIFPTAARESQEPEEREWLEKQATAAVSLKLDLSDLAPHERNPEWLKGKAESLFKKEDYRSAVNAYSLAIRMRPNMYSLYLGRSACHLRLRNLHKCIEDSSKALELLVPPVPSNAKDRLESHQIRGMAFQQLDLPLEGLMDFEAALKIRPNDEELKKNAEILRALIQDIGE